MSSTPFLSGSFLLQSQQSKACPGALKEQGTRWQAKGRSEWIQGCSVAR